MLGVLQERETEGLSESEDRLRGGGGGGGIEREYTVLRVLVAMCGHEVSHSG